MALTAAATALQSATHPTLASADQPVRQWGPPIWAPEPPSEALERAEARTREVCLAAVAIARRQI